MTIEYSRQGVAIARRRPDLDLQQGVAIAVLQICFVGVREISSERCYSVRAPKGQRVRATYGLKWL